MSAGTYVEWYAWNADEEPIPAPNDGLDEQHLFLTKERFEAAVVAYEKAKKTNESIEEKNKKAEETWRKMKSKPDPSKPTTAKPVPAELVKLPLLPQKYEGWVRRVTNVVVPQPSL